MKANKESWGWGGEQRFPCGDSATRVRSGKWQGYLETSCDLEWEGKGGSWNQFISDDGNIFAEFENIMQWDDSGAQEAFLYARERHQASVRGLMYPVSLPDPDLYIQTVDWDTHEVFDLPESADMISTRGERKRQRRRAPKREQFQCDRKGIGKSGRSYHLEAGDWRQKKNETISHRNFWQRDLRQSGLDKPMPDTNGLSNATPKISGWEEENPSQLKSSWKNWQTGHFGWQSNPLAQPSYEDRLNRSSEQAALPNRWVYGNDTIQAPVGMQAAFGTSGVNDVNSGGWMGHYHMGGQNMQHYSMVRHCLQDNRDTEKLGREHFSLGDGTQRWRQSNWQWHDDRY